LYRASDQMLSHFALDATLGWRDLADDIQVRIVPGNHGSITGEPFVRKLAETLCEDLDAAQRVASHGRLPIHKQLLFAV
jgi:thioesterase domain-containing protein